MSHKTWCFTLNNYTSEDESRLSRLFEDGVASFIIYGREISPTTGTPHLQGVITLKRAARQGAIKRIVGGRAHVEPARNVKQAIEYCRKDGDIVEFGSFNGGNRGKRNDIHDGALELQEHRDINRFKLEHPELWVKFPRGFGTLLVKPESRPNPYVTWIYGPTGTGKTRYVTGREPKLWLSSGSLKWFDGYFNQPAVLLDDFRGDFCKFHFLLRLLDRYPFSVEVKGGSVPWDPLRIYITSPYHPGATYQSIEDPGQLLRRCDEILHLTHKPGSGNDINRPSFPDVKEVSYQQLLNELPPSQQPTELGCEESSIDLYALEEPLDIFIDTEPEL